ncbi:hypothetical protein FOL47_010099 [Perkinsus chesapeaki]|uniref:Uncharacterized protein n=1 Tax=Perkinsus chesapeaki TaxID=330153 RepID=A0A7J6L4V2_PERCH|nr:hypothetical protein FOL47_010099 [Perkinsus chesapeaki]
MVIQILYMKANLDGLSELTAPTDHYWCFDVAGTNTDEIRERVTVNCMDKEEVSGSRGTANLVINFKGLKKEATIVQTNVKKMKINQTYTADDSDKWVPLIAFECRGCEITKWHPHTGYRAISTGGGTVFENVDLSDDWCDYDADNDASVGVYDLEWKLEQA